MTNRYSRNITPDYLTGFLSACEGIRDSLVLQNGPLGCRFYHAYASGQSLIKSQELWHLEGGLKLRDAMDNKLFRSQYYAGRGEVPGSNLRYEDYIFGTREQLHRALNDMFTERTYSVFSVIQCPGTSLLGEDLQGELEDISREYGIPFIYLESPEFSKNLFLGYDDGTVRLLELLCKDTPEGTGENSGTDSRDKSRRPEVNLFGFYTYERYLEGDILEIRRLLELCGISVNCVMGANCTKDEVKRVPEADLQILLGPERCLRTGEYLKKHFGKPVLETGALPVGFDLTEKFLKDVCEILGADPSAALEEVDRYRARAFYYIGRHMGSRGFPGELCYAAEGEWSLLAGYVDFFSGYLGMRAAAIHPLYTQCSGTGREVFREMIKRYGLEDAAERKIEDVKDVILLGSANTILEIQTYSGNVYGIETSIPSSGYIDVVPKTHLGCRGALYLLEQVLNGVRLLKAWK